MEKGKASPSKSALGCCLYTLAQGVRAQKRPGPGQICRTGRQSTKIRGSVDKHPAYRICPQTLLAFLKGSRQHTVRTLNRLHSSKMFDIGQPRPQPAGRGAGKVLLYYSGKADGQMPRQRGDTAGLIISTPATRNRVFTACLYIAPARYRPVERLSMARTCPSSFSASSGVSKPRRPPGSPRPFHRSGPCPCRLIPRGGRTGRGGKPAQQRTRLTCPPILVPVRELVEI